MASSSSSEESDFDEDLLLPPPPPPWDPPQNAFDADVPPAAAPAAIPDGDTNLDKLPPPLLPPPLLPPPPLPPPPDDISANTLQLMESPVISTGSASPVQSSAQNEVTQTKASRDVHTELDDTSSQPQVNAESLDRTPQGHRKRRRSSVMDLVNAFRRGSLEQTKKKQEELAEMHKQRMTELAEIMPSVEMSVSSNLDKSSDALDAEMDFRSTSHQKSSTHRRKSFAPELSADEAWQMLSDPKSGKTYWWNPATQKSQWTNPSETPEAITKAAIVQDGVNRDTNQPRLNDEWVTVKDPASGQSYFYNKVTNSSRWTNPSDDVSPAESLHSNESLPTVQSVGRSTSDFDNSTTIISELRSQLLAEQNAHASAREEFRLAIELERAKSNDQISQIRLDYDQQLKEALHDSNQRKAHDAAQILKLTSQIEKLSELERNHEDLLLEKEEQVAALQNKLLTLRKLESVQNSDAQKNKLDTLRKKLEDSSLENIGLRTTLNEVISAKNLAERRYAESEEMRINALAKLKAVNQNTFQEEERAKAQQRKEELKSLMNCISNIASSIIPLLSEACKNADSFRENLAGAAQRAVEAASGRMLEDTNADVSQSESPSETQSFKYKRGTSQVDVNAKTAQETLSRSFSFQQVILQRLDEQEHRHRTEVRELKVTSQKALASMAKGWAECREKLTNCQDSLIKLSEEYRIARLQADDAAKKVVQIANDYSSKVRRMNGEREHFGKSSSYRSPKSKPTSHRSGHDNDLVDARLLAVDRLLNSAGSMSDMEKSMNLNYSDTYHSVKKEVENVAGIEKEQGGDAARKMSFRQDSLGTSLSFSEDATSGQQFQGNGPQVELFIWRAAMKHAEDLRIERSSRHRISTSLLAALALEASTFVECSASSLALCKKLRQIERALHEQLWGNNKVNKKELLVGTDEDQEERVVISKSDDVSQNAFVEKTLPPLSTFNYHRRPVLPLPQEDLSKMSQGSSEVRIGPPKGPPPILSPLQKMTTNPSPPRMPPSNFINPLLHMMER